MSNNTKTRMLKVTLVIAAILLIIALTIFAICYPLLTKKDAEPRLSPSLTIYDHIHNSHVTLNIPCRIDTNNKAYIEGEKVFENAKSELLKLDSRFLIDIYSDVLLYARIPQVATYYITRQYSQESPYGELYYLYNTQVFDFGTPKAPKPRAAFLPLHLFSATHELVGEDFKFGSPIAKDTKLAISGDINDFYNFYADEPNIEVTREDMILYIRDKNIDQGFWAVFEDNFVTYTPIE